MVAAAPFQGLRFDPSAVDIARVIAPPYDVISEADRRVYEARSPYNVVRLILAQGGRDDPARYDQVGKLIDAWREEGTLRLDPAPALYLYEERYQLRGQERVQRGVLACVTLDDTGTWILPHERTMQAPVADRLRLLEATRANLSPVFGVYAGGGRAAAVLDDLTGEPPAVDCVDETGTRHRLWPVFDGERIAAWCRLLAEQRVLIADGHHRYRTSLLYRDRMRAAHPDAPHGPWDQVLMYLVDADLHGPSILAIHRLLARVPGSAVLSALAPEFNVEAVASPAEAEARLAATPGEQVAYGLYAGGQTWLLTARDAGALAAEVGLGRRPLDVEVLHGPVLARRLGLQDFEREVTYESDLASAVRQVDGGASACALLLRPVPFATVAEIARAGGTLPQKTTFFYPKPKDGLVLRPFAPEPRPGGAG